MRLYGIDTPLCDLQQMPVMTPAESIVQNPPVARPRSVWVISDGKAGHLAQCLGVAAALGVEPTVKRIAAAGSSRFIAPWGRPPTAARFGQSGSAFEPPWPQIALATGRLTVPYIRALKKFAGAATFTVILLDPKTGPDSADLVWTPAHDKLRGPNVITSLTSPHAFSASRIAALRESLPAAVADLPSPRIAVLIGGPNRDFRYAGDEATILGEALGALAASGASLMITPSRRTPPAFIEAVDAATRPYRRLLWDGSGDNPYPAFLAGADAFVVTADSVNMTCEAAATGRPIHVFRPAGTSAKFDRFHAALEAYGATRPLSAPAALADWSYAPLDSARDIANEILERWRRRVEMLPGLAGAGAG